MPKKIAMKHMLHTEVRILAILWPHPPCQWSKCWTETNCFNRREWEDHRFFNIVGTLNLRKKWLEIFFCVCVDVQLPLLSIHNCSVSWMQLQGWLLILLCISSVCPSCFQYAASAKSKGVCAQPHISGTQCTSSYSSMIDQAIATARTMDDRPYHALQEVLH